MRVSHFTTIMVDGKADSTNAPKPKALSKREVDILLARVKHYRSKGLTAYVCEVKQITDSTLENLHNV